MRLICPNCGAQYEVSEDAIPDAGRDVQCSNCSHTWFEVPGASEKAEAATHVSDVKISDRVADHDEDDIGKAEVDGADAPDQPDEVEDAIDEIDHRSVAEADPEPEIEADPEVDAEPNPEPQSDPEPERTARREIDPSVSAILREERDLELSRRRDEKPAADSHSDLNLDDLGIYDEQLADEPDFATTAATTGAAAAAATATVAVVRRSELDKQDLPDVDEINSTLDPDDGFEALVDAPVIEEEPKSYFWKMFWLVVILALIAWAIYYFAPQISEAIPSLKATLDSYVSWVDGVREWLRETSNSLGDRLSSTDAQTDPTPTPDATPMAEPEAAPDVTTDAPEMPSTPEMPADNG